ncbi:MAG TPA: hypothetical protein VHP12_02730 [Chitinophagaceae bacterium]|nr:hypothetical protein [Chitinophagaceae bacterium]
MKQNFSFKSYGLLIILLMGIFARSFAQTTAAVDSSVYDRLNYLEEQINYHKSGDDHFMVVGLTTFGFASNKTTNTLNGVTTKSRTNSFADANHYEFSPMFLWRHGKKFLMEFEPSFANNGLGVNWADISYFATPNLIIRAGYLVLPFGTYSKKQAAGWINKLATDPMGITALPTTDYGVEIEGGLPIGSMKMNYDFALSNGLQLNADGTLTGGNIVDNNNNKTFTGRLGILPFSNSSLELGVSGMFGKVGNYGSSFQDVKGNMYAFDLNYVKTFVPILLNIKGQYNIVNIGDANYVSPVDTTQTYTFKNHSTAGFIQCAIRPTGIQALHDLELAARYTTYSTPSNSTFGSDQHSFSIGLNYWLSWRAVARITYETYTGNSTASQALNAFTGTTNSNTLYLQFSIQL